MPPLTGIISSQTIIDNDKQPNTIQNVIQLDGLNQFIVIVTAKALFTLGQAVTITIQ